MTEQEDADRLGEGGRALWIAINDQYDLDGIQRVLLLLACRQKDWLDVFDRTIRGDGRTLAELTTSRGQTVAVTLKDVHKQANASARAMTQLLAAMRLPGETGKRPQRRGGSRGVYRPRGIGS